MLAAALALTIEVAWAEDDAAHADLAHAVQRYLDGDVAGAREALQSLLARGPSLPAEVRREALLWLGDVLFLEGGPRAAQNVLEALLAEDPAYVVDPVAHAPALVAYFETLRPKLVRPEAPSDPPAALPLPAAPEPRPFPSRAVVPFGVGYFLDEKPAVGAIVGGLQAIGLGVSVALYVDLSDRYPKSGTFAEGEEAELEAFYRQATINQLVATAGTLAYVVPLAIETGVWAARPRLAMSVGPTTVTFSGRF
jgi:hypothetical protein